jgi:hypothetical protein
MFDFSTAQLKKTPKELQMYGQTDHDFEDF